MKLQNLYKKTSTGAIQSWLMEIEDNKFRTISGQIDGLKVTSEWTICEGKNIGKANATSGAEQALKECEASYKLKAKGGYFNTPRDAAESNVFKPMLADKFEDYKDKVEQALKQGKKVYSQPKLDGIRCIAREGTLTSRPGNPIVSCPHISEALKKIFDRNPSLVLDGELYSHDLHDDFNKIVSLVSKEKTRDLPAAQAATKDIVQYWIYDTPSSEKFSERNKTISIVAAKVGLPIVYVTTDEVLSMQHLDELYDSYLENGFEGQMIRLNESYENKRSHSLLKRKEFEDSEFEVIRVEEGVGNSAGCARRCYLKLDIDPTKTFKADILGTREHTRKLLSVKDSLIGAQATVKYFKKRTPEGVPRFGKVKAFHTDGIKL